jgi:hypothetical protein
MAAERIYNNLDVMSIIDASMRSWEHVAKRYNYSFDNDNDSGEISMTMPDGSEWIIQAKKVEQNECIHCGKNTKNYCDLCEETVCLDCQPKHDQLKSDLF